jgi:predicted nucleic acid-binding protein
MKELVVDASVAAKWFLPELHGDRAMRLFSGRQALIAPDLLIAEFGNILWKQVRRRTISADDASLMVEDMRQLPVQIVASGPLIGTALQLAIATDRTVYDCLYLSLAVDRDCPLVTADERFANSLKATPYASHVRWIGVRQSMHR